MRWFLLVAVVATAWAQSPEIRIDQVGYLPGSAKVAVVVSDSAGENFSLKRKGSDEALFTGKIGEPTRDTLSGDTVRWADFSELRDPGEYVIEVENLGPSYPFTIGADVFRRTYYLALRSFYGQRCGTGVDLGDEFPGYRYEACHANGRFHGSSGRTEDRASTYGWHDAGDYGRYIVNSGITTGTLLWTYEMFKPRIEAISLNLPESANSTPDILDEIRWNLEWMLTMQDEDGGVWHKQTSASFPGFVMPERDTTVSLIVGTGAAPFKSSCATGDFAAVLAIAGRVYKPFDADFANRATESATRAWQWLNENPNVMFRNPTGVSTGEYGDGNCSDERLWAAAELWRTTGDTSFNEYVQQNYRAFLPRASTPPGWNSVGALGLWTYALGRRDGSDETVVAAIRERTAAAAEQLAMRTLQSPYRTTMTAADFNWGSNSVAANYGLLFLIADALQPDERFKQAALENIHYLLGRNAFSVSWVTQVGSNPFRHPHHRPSGADKNPEPWPGLLSGGPNRNRTQDNVLRRFPEGLPAMKYWADEQDSYASNENAINWNAPLVFLLAGTLPDPTPAAP